MSDVEQGTLLWYQDQARRLIQDKVDLQAENAKLQGELEEARKSGIRTATLLITDLNEAQEELEQAREQREEARQESLDRLIAVQDLESKLHNQRKHDDWLSVRLDHVTEERDAARKQLAEARDVASRLIYDSIENDGTFVSVKVRLLNELTRLVGRK